MNPAIREAVLWRPTLHDGISLNFQTGQHYVKRIGGVVSRGALTDFFTFTGGNQSMYMGPAGLLVQSVTNTPRIEYDASGNCLGLLMEAARTNLCLESQTLGTTWSPTTAAVSSNSAAAPDGTSTADTLRDDSTAGSIHQLAQSIAFAATTTYSFSAWVKPAGRSWIELRYSAGFGTATSAFFNLSGSGSVGTLLNAPTATIVAYPNGWYRCSVTATSGGAPSGGQVIFRLATGDNVSVYDGDGASGAYIWGCQLEAGAFASSYIPTTTASVDRIADSCIRTLGAEFSVTAGAAVVTSRSSGGQSTGAQGVWSFDDGTTANRITLARGANSNSARINVSAGGVAQAQTDATISNSTMFKHATAWASNDVASSLNGAAVLTDATVTVPSVTSLFIGGLATGFQGSCHILKFDYYPTRLPNADLLRLAA